MGDLAIARQLGLVASEYKELTEGRIFGNILPRNVYDGGGAFVAAMPAIYMPQVSS
jgi:hypothetical protein